MEQLGFDLTPVARSSDPWTSHAAGRKAVTHSSVGRLLVLRALLVGPMNDFELASHTGWIQTSIGKRRLECQRIGWVQAHLIDGKQAARPSPSGSRSLVWEITSSGRRSIEPGESV